MKVSGYSKKLDPIFKYGYEGLLKTEEYMIDYFKLDLQEEDYDELLDIIFDDELNSLEHTSQNEGALFASVHAVLILGRLEVDKYFNILLSHLDNISEDDDYFYEATIYFLKKTGFNYVDKLISVLLDQTKTVRVRSAMIDVLEK